jgi:outer membrane receptor protein involved in Fe transport
LSTTTSQQIQTNTTQDFGNLFFTQPGATSAGLSPGASRPILRGLTDFRVRLQENGSGSSDVSNLGQDHGVPLDPLTIDKTEIYRGPAALRYGSQAIGGIVEAINNRIPMYVPPSGIAAELRAAGTTVNNGWESALLLDAGGPNAAIHADMFGRRADDYRIEKLVARGRIEHAKAARQRFFGRVEQYAAIGADCEDRVRRRAVLFEHDRSGGIVFGVDDVVRVAVSHQERLQAQHIG